MSKYNIHSDFTKYENTKLPLSPLLLQLINALMAVSVKKSGTHRGADFTKEANSRLSRWNG